MARFAAKESGVFAPLNFLQREMRCVMGDGRLCFTNHIDQGWKPGGGGQHSI